VNAVDQAAGDARVARRVAAHLQALASHACLSAVDAYILACVEENGRALRRAALAGSTTRLLHLAEGVEAAGAARRIRLAHLDGTPVPPGPGEDPLPVADPGDTGEWVLRIEPNTSIGTVIGDLLEIEGFADTDALRLVATRRDETTGAVDLVFLPPPAAAETDPNPDDGPLPLPVPAGAAVGTSG
jgi:hypothetical protein